MKLIKKLRYFIYHIGSKIIESLPKKKLFKMFPGFYDIALLYRTKTYAKRGDIVVQAGVDMGKGKQSNALLLSKAVGKHGRVVAIEPDPTNIRKLNNIIKKKRIDNILVVNKAVWNVQSTITLFLGEDTAGKNRLETVPTLKKTDMKQSLYNYYNQFKGSINVKADTIDNILKKNNIKQVSHICLTINGAELEALEGMKEILKSKNMSILIVHHKIRPKVGGIPIAKKISTQLKSHGFNVKIGKRWIIASN